MGTSEPLQWKFWEFRRKMSFIIFLLEYNCFTMLRSVQFSRSVVSDSLQPHESQHARPPCPSPTPGVHSNSRPLSRWCYPAISSSVASFSSCPNPSQHQSLINKIKCTSLKNLSFGNGMESWEGDFRSRECFITFSHLNCEIKFTNFFSFFGCMVSLGGHSSVSRDWTQNHAVEVWDLNHWTIREFPNFPNLN